MLRWMRAKLIAGVMVGAITSGPCLGEFQINTYHSYDQSRPAVACGATENFAVVWSSYRQDGASGGIYGQIYEPNGCAIGDEFRINELAEGHQCEPHVAAAATGDFVVVWQGPGADQTDTDTDIFCRRFDTWARPMSGQWRVNTETSGRQQHGRVGMNRYGRFVVVWDSYVAQDGLAEWIVAAQVYEPQGKPAGQQLTVNLLLGARYPDVAVAPNGRFVVVWLEDRLVNRILARLYEADGRAATAPFQVNTVPFRSVTRPVVAMDERGRFVVAWDGHPDSAAEDDIYMRLYDDKGRALTDPVIVNRVRAGAQQYPAVWMNSQGQFVVAWQSASGAGGNGRDIHAQRFNEYGKPVGPELQPHNFVRYDQRYPSVALSSTGIFMIVWQSDRQDGSGEGVFGMIEPVVSPADFTGDGYVNFRDYCRLASIWEQEPYLAELDLETDGVVDFCDLVEFCRWWSSRN